MKKTNLIAVGVAVAVLVTAVVIFALTRRDNTTAYNNNVTSQSSQSQAMSSKASSAAVTSNAPIAFSKVGKGILDAKDDYSMFTFKNGVGSCLSQGFPTDLVYDSENIAKTLDGKFMDDATTSVDFAGNIGFRGLKLTTGDANCVASTSSSSDKADVKCSVGTVEVCTVSFDFFAVK